MSEQLARVLIIGAHPDDGDIKAGGTAALWTEAGYVVRFVSLTDGRAGHHLNPGPAMAERRRAEARAAGAIIGAAYDVLDHPDGELDTRLEYRHELIRLIRSDRPDLIVTHRTNDYHPDHRSTGLLVQDASYLLTVPAVCPDVPHLTACPVILSFSDSFTRPCRFEPDVVVDIGDRFETIVRMLHQHASQFYEWLPYNAGFSGDVPEGDDERFAWLSARFRERIAPLADRFRDRIVATYGEERGASVRLIEAFEVSEYGAPLDSETRARLFPFLPADAKAGASFVRKSWVDQPEAD